MIQVSVPAVIGANKLPAHLRNIEGYPNECPVCHYTITPDYLNIGFTNMAWVELVFRCTNTKCFRTFIAIYMPDGNTREPNLVYQLKSTCPVEPCNRNISAEVAAVSPSFVRIVQQAQAAEGHGLDEVAGPGFRKALEFLIKDFAISLQASESDETKREQAIADIKKIQLMPVISKYLTGEKLPMVSSRAAWLGNDETHYERRWVGKDLSDLKKLIAAVEHFISMEKLVADLPTEMPDPKLAQNAANS